MNTSDSWNIVEYVSLTSLWQNLMHVRPRKDTKAANMAVALLAGLTRTVGKCTHVTACLSFNAPA